MDSTTKQKRPLAAVWLAIILEAILCFSFLAFGRISFIRSEDTNLIATLIGLFHVPGILITGLCGMFLTTGGLLLTALIGVAQWYLLIIAIRRLRQRAEERRIKSLSQD